jgi:hypothetical protein
MSRLLIRLLLLALPFALFVAWFEHARGGRETSLFSVKRHLLESAASSVEVLSVGPSHAHDGILPDRMHPHAFNLGGVSQSLYYDCALVKKYAPTLPSLRLVVLPLSYFTMESELDQGTESWRAYYYFHYHGIPHRDWRLDTHLRNWSSWFLYGRDHGLAAIRGTTPPEIRGDYDPAGGWIEERRGETSQSPRDLASSVEKTLARHHAGMNPAQWDANQRRLADLLVFLRGRGLDAVFVTLPVSSGYRAGEHPDVLSRIGTMMAGFKREFGVEWHDYSGDPRFGPGDFADADHLNFTGAAKFSRWFGTEVVQPATARPRRP